MGRREVRHSKTGFLSVRLNLCRFMFLFRKKTNVGRTAAVVLANKFACSL